MNSKIIKELEKQPVFLKTIYNLSKDLDESLAHDIRLELSQNSETPLEILEDLIKDTDKQIKLNVLKQSQTSNKIIQSALKDEDDDIRIMLFKNFSQNISENDLFACFKDKNEEVVKLARKALKSKL